MQQLKLPAEVLEKIDSENSETQVVDAAGTVKGYLVSPEYRSLVYSWVNTLFTDDEELRLARAETGGYTTPEAVAYLRRIQAARKGSP